MQNECIRLRDLLEESLKNNQNKEKEEEIEQLRNELNSKEDEIKQMRSDNTAMAQACKDKDDHIKIQSRQLNEARLKSEKQKKSIADHKKTKKIIKEKDQEIMRLK